MECGIGIKLIDRVSNVEIQTRMKLEDAGYFIPELKYSWAGHFARRGDNRWSKVLTEWRPRTGVRIIYSNSNSVSGDKRWASNSEMIDDIANITVRI